MKKVILLFALMTLGMLPYPSNSQDNGNLFNLIWDDPDEIVGNTVGFFQYGSETYQTLHLINDYDNNGFKEIVGWDFIDEHYFVIEAEGDNAFKLKRFYHFFPFIIDLNDDGIDEGINLDIESDPDNVVIQLVTYNAALDSFVINRDIGNFPKPVADAWGGIYPEYLTQYYVEKGNFDDDENSEFVIFSYDRWVNPSGGQTTHLVVFELTGDDPTTAGIKIEHLETIVSAAFQVPATIAAADFDNDGHREMVMVSLEAKRIYVYESVGEDHYEFVHDASQYGPDAEHTFKSHSYIGDLDGDELDDVWYCGAHGTVYVIPGTGSYETTFTNDNSTKLYKIEGASEIQGGVVGDCDGDGKPNIYWWDLPTEAIYQMEYQGGDIRNPDNYLFSMIYQSNTSDYGYTRFEGINIGGIRTGVVDLDNDDKREIVIGSSNAIDQGTPGLYIFESEHVASAVDRLNHRNLIPGDFKLTSYPNPTRSLTTIQYELYKPSFVTLNLYNICGQLVQSLDKESRLVGKHSVRFDTKGLTSGIFFIRLKTNYGQKTLKLFVSN